MISFLLSYEALLMGRHHQRAWLLRESGILLLLLIHSLEIIKAHLIQF